MLDCWRSISIPRVRLRLDLLWASARGRGADTRARLMPRTSPKGFFSRPALFVRAADDFVTLRFLAKVLLPSSVLCQTLGCEQLTNLVARQQP